MKPLHWNLVFFLIRASRGPFHLKHKTQGPSHIHIPKGKTPLEVLVQRWLTSSFEDRESALIPRGYGVPGFFILLLYWNWCSYRLEMGVSGNLWNDVKDVKTLVLYDVEWEISMDSMKGKCAASCVDLGYTNQFCVPEVTSVFFSSCDSVVGDSLEFSQANRGSLCVWFGKRNCSACNAWESGLISWRRGSLMGFLELRQAPGVYTRVTTRMPILNGSLFSEVRTLV